MFVIRLAVFSALALLTACQTAPTVQLTPEQLSAAQTNWLGKNGKGVGAAVAPEA